MQVNNTQNYDIKSYLLLRGVYNKHLPLNNIRRCTQGELDTAQDTMGKKK